MPKILEGRKKPKRGATTGFTVEEVRKAFTKTERKRAAQHLDDVVQWFGPKGVRWIQGDYSATDYDYDSEDAEVETACLVGAMEKVDGPYAYAAQQMLLAVLPKTYDNQPYENIEDFNDSGATNFTRVKRVIGKAKKALLA